jgi:hypothetical protein
MNNAPPSYGDVAHRGAHRGLLEKRAVRRARG